MCLLREFLDASRTIGLDALLTSLKFDGAHHGSLVKCAIGRAEFGIDWEAAAAEPEYTQEVFSLYDYDTGRVYESEEQVGYVSVHDSRTNGAGSLLVCLCYELVAVPRPLRFFTLSSRRCISKIPVCFVHRHREPVHRSLILGTTI